MEKINKKKERFGQGSISKTWLPSTSANFVLKAERELTKNFLSWEV